MSKRTVSARHQYARRRTVKAECNNSVYANPCKRHLSQKGMHGTVRQNEKATQYHNLVHRVYGASVITRSTLPDPTKTENIMRFVSSVHYTSYKYKRSKGTSASEARIRQPSDWAGSCFRVLMVRILSSSQLLIRSNRGGYAQQAAVRQM